MKVLKWSGIAGVGVVAAPVVLIGGLFIALFGSRLLSGLGGPNFVTPVRSAIVGVWTNPDGARLVLSADGTAVASRMPDLRGSAPGSGDDMPYNGTGTWWIEQLPGDVGEVQVNIGNWIPELDATGDPAHPSLIVTIGDPDDADYFTFTKQSG